jgi:hypothetical protein
MEPLTSDPLAGIVPEDAAHPRYIHIGVDIGQSVDPSAYAITEVVQRSTGHLDLITRTERPSDRFAAMDKRSVAAGYSFAPTLETVYLVREFRRLELGHPYAEYAEQIAAKICAPGIYRKSRRVFIDATGVGRSVAEDIERVARQREKDLSATQGPGGPLSFQRVRFTAGDDYNRVAGTMGKRYLVSRLLSVSRSRPVRMVLAAGGENVAQWEVDAMYQELHDYQIRVSRDGADTYGAMRTGAHDDLVTAAGLTAIEDPATYRTLVGPRIWG